MDANVILLKRDSSKPSMLYFNVLPSVEIGNMDLYHPCEKVNAQYPDRQNLTIP